MNLADGWMDRTDDEHTDGHMEFQVESDRQAMQMTYGSTCHVPDGMTDRHI